MALLAAEHLYRRLATERLGVSGRSSPLEGFSVGRAVETRYIERLANGQWSYATYIWNDTGTDATLAPAEGVRSMPVEGAPNGRYTVPARAIAARAQNHAPEPLPPVAAKE